MSISVEIPPQPPAVSFVVPVYNSASVLKATLSSILAQTLTQIEVIVVDDGSTDKSLSIARQFSEVDPRVHVIANAHGGVSSARNTGLKQATGDWVTFIDSDDEISPEYAEIGRQLMHQPPVDLIIFSMSLITIDGATKQTENWLVSDECFDSTRAFLAALIERGKMCFYSTGNKLYRRSILLRESITFEESRTFGEDRVFNFEYVNHCRKILTHSHIAYHYYRRPNIATSASRVHRPERLSLLLDLHEKKKALLLRFGFSEDRALDFLTADLSREIHDSINASKQQWLHLDRDQKRGACSSFTHADYPSYLKDIRPPTFTGRLFFWALRNRHTRLLYLFFSLKS